MMKKFWGLKQEADWHPSDHDWTLAYELVASRKVAYADTVAQAMFADMMLGDYGGSYYVDGRKVPNNVPDLYGVGGAMTGIDESSGEIRSVVDVQAACELMRDGIVSLQDTSDDPVCIGFWRDADQNGLTYFDVSNVIKGKEQANALAVARHEIAFYDFYNDCEVRCVYAGCGTAGYKRAAKGYADFMRRRHNNFSTN